jgi:hypothetical protein
MTYHNLEQKDKIWFFQKLNILSWIKSLFIGKYVCLKCNSQSLDGQYEYYCLNCHEISIVKFDW